MKPRAVDHMSSVPNEVREVEDSRGSIWEREGHTDKWRCGQLVLWNYQLDEYGPFQFQEG